MPRDAGPGRDQAEALALRNGCRVRADSRDAHQLAALSQTITVRAAHHARWWRNVLMTSDAQHLSTAGEAVAERSRLSIMRL
jgi:hypothetical protein